MRCLLIPDVKGWAWDFKAQALKRCLKDEFEKIDIRYSHVKWKLFEKYHTVHFFGWHAGPKISSMSTCGVSSYNWHFKHYKKAKIKIPRFRAVSAVSKMIYDDLKHHKMNKHIYLCENGVDEEMFYPQKNNGEFTVGWVGQPTKRPLDQHGYETIWMPIRDQLIAKNIKFVEMTNTHKNAIPHERMIDFYRGIDVLVHTGRMTGTPNPLFEAAACGKALVSTKIGAAPELIKTGPEGNGMCFEFRNGPHVQQMVELIEDMKKNRDKTEVLGQNARKEIEKNWTWKKKAREWLPILKNHARVL